MAREVLEVVANNAFPPNEPLVKVLTELLELAKNGRLRSLGYAAAIAEGINKSAYAQHHLSVDADTTFCISHAIAMLGHEWLELCRNRSIDISRLQGQAPEGEKKLDS